MPQEYTGRITRIIFSKPEDGFYIFELQPPSSSKVKCKGTFYGIEIRTHMDITVVGEWGRRHPKYGRDFQVSTYEEVEPDDVEGITRYLIANVKGVGPATARKIADHFGPETVSKLTGDPALIYGCQFLTDTQRELVYKAISENVGYRDISVFLMSFDVSPSMVSAIYRKFGNRAVEVLTEDPYNLMDIRGVAFRKADAIATRMGIDSRSPVRIRAVIKYLLDDVFAVDGHLFATRDQLRSKALSLLEAVPAQVFWAEVENLTLDGKVTVDGHRIYSTRHYNNEVGSAMCLSEMVGTVDCKVDVDAYLDGYNQAHRITLSPEQRQAVHAVARNRVVVITGLPGTGKTTCSKAIVGLFDRLYTPGDIALMAPTGIASKRLQETTGRPAGTIHRILGSRGDGQWSHDEHNPHPAMVIGVDEFSMVDQSLMHRLLRGVRPNARLFLVGDVAQLPSVGPGNVLREVIKSGVVPVVELTTIHRQDEASDIIINAHRINSGDPLLIDNANPATDFKFVHLRKDMEILERMLRTARALKDRGWEFQCISPRHKGTLGVENLNEHLRESLNPDVGQDAIVVGPKNFRVGDRVIVTRNNYNLKVFNGDIGTVVSIDTSNREVQFQVDGNSEPTVFSSGDASRDLMLAYCITIHRSQGSEWDVVIMPIVKSFSIQLVRNLFYTAVTRARRKVLVYGQLGAAEKAIRNNKVRHRNTALSERLRGVTGRV